MVAKLSTLHSRRIREDHYIFDDEGRRERVVVGGGGIFLTKVFIQHVALRACVRDLVFFCNFLYNPPDLSLLQKHNRSVP